MNSKLDQHQRIKEWVARAVHKNHIAHAYLFAGKKGSGKKDMAIYFAQSLFCEEKVEGSPCLECLQCQRIENRNHPNVHWVEPQGASIKIDQVRELQKEFSYRGLEENQKIYMIDQIETMTTQAANSLLKFLEEPHAGSLAILMTQQRHALLPTILSRCQEIKFPPPLPAQMIESLIPEYGKSLASLSSHITADMEEALSLCQSDWFAELRNLVIQLTEELEKNSSNSLFLIQDKWLNVAKEKEQTDIGLELLLFWYKDLLYTKLELQDKFIYIDQTERLRKQTLLWSKERITRGLGFILEAKRRLHANVNPQLLLEQLVLRLQGG